MSRPLLISGFMATGKTRVGKLAAELKSARWVDLDQEIESRAARSVRAIFEESGEKEFRRLERETLLELVKRGENESLVVSLGGGALVDRGFRIEVLSRAVVVTLSASAEEIVRRVENQDGGASRPLLRGENPLEKVQSLLETRRIAYRESHAQIDTEGRAPEEIARDVVREWEKDAVCVASGDESYVVTIGSDLIEPTLGPLVGSVSGTLLVTDDNVSPLHGDKARRALSPLSGKKAEVILTPGEEHKNLDGLAQIVEAAFSGSIDRKATFVGLGGGVVTDMTGFAAATWVRGVRWIGCPTTLLSMVDASVGGKTAVDYKTAKNSVGAFWQPGGVICDVETLKTETERMYVGALSEVVKTALIGDAPLLDFLEENADGVLARDMEIAREVVDRCVRVKARVVALDEREAGIRATLNLGHTIGHALESASGYTGLTHGEAVSLGLVAAMRVGEKKGHTPTDLTARVLRLLKRLGLPHQLEQEKLRASTELIGHDKKRAGNSIRFVYARGAGDVFTESIELSELEALSPTLADPS